MQETTEIQLESVRHYVSMGFFYFLFYAAFLLICFSLSTIVLHAHTYIHTKARLQESHSILAREHLQTLNILQSQKASVMLNRLQAYWFCHVESVRANGFCQQFRLKPLHVQACKTQTDHSNARKVLRFPLFIDENHGKPQT